MGYRSQGVPRLRAGLGGARDIREVRRSPRLTLLYMLYLQRICALRSVIQVI